MAKKIRDVDIYNFHSKQSFAFVLLKRISDFETENWQLQQNNTRRFRDLVKLGYFVQNLDRRILSYWNVALFFAPLLFCIEIRIRVYTFTVCYFYCSPLFVSFHHVIRYLKYLKTI